MPKHRTVRVIASSILPRTEYGPPPTPLDELVAAWREEVALLPPPAHWRFNDYMAAFDELNFPVDAEMLRHFARCAMAAYEESSRRSNEQPLSARTPRPPKGRHEPIVYYFRLGDLVKIGTTIDIWNRRANVPCQGVMAVEWGSYDLEQQRHSEFVDSHQWGEWFHLDEQIGAHIVEVRARFEASVGKATEHWLEEMRWP